MNQRKEFVTNNKINIPDPSPLPALLMYNECNAFVKGGPYT